jgi:pyruvate,water dikinase
MLLQSRPLRVEKKEKEKTVSDPVPGYPVLMEGGSIASPGVGCGTAHIVTSEADLLSFPDNGILIAPNSSPRFVIVMPKAQAILTNAGSVTGHMASLAREYHVPALLNTKTATTAILPGQTITVDANAGRVYAGCVTELLEAKRPRSAFMKDSLVFESLKKISSLIIPLNLINPKSSHFTPANCKTVHDIMRFIHEASYGEIFQLSDIGTDEGKIAVKLQAPLPIDLYVIDLGGGIDAGLKKGKNAKREHITSIPFKALLDGMLNEDLRHHIPRPINVSGFFSVMSEQMLSPHHAGNERFGDKSYAIISDKYMNFSSRVGYHYSVLDAYCGDTAMKNYIHFQFKGGAADNVRRNRRARLIQQILEKMEFWVEVQSDRVTARLGKNGAEVIKEKLDTIGKLLIFTRQMDMLMQSEAAIHQLADRFLKGMYAFDPESLI